MPVLTNGNPARIANGLGGTINLIASVVLISLMLAGIGGIMLWNGQANLAPLGNPVALAGILGVGAGGVLAGLVAMIIGARHLARLEF